MQDSSIGRRQLMLGALGAAASTAATPLFNP